MNVFIEVGLFLVFAFPFAAAGWLFIAAIRAIVKGEVRTGGGLGGGFRTVYKHSEPVRFWMEIGLYFLVGIALALFGLEINGDAPNWFHQLCLLMKESRHAKH